MATVVVGCMCVQSTIVEGTDIMQAESSLLPVEIFTGCKHVTMATVLIGYEVVQSLILIHINIVK